MRSLHARETISEFMISKTPAGWRALSKRADNTKYLAPTKEALYHVLVTEESGSYVKRRKNVWIVKNEVPEHVMQRRYKRETLAKNKTKTANVVDVDASA